MDHCLFKVLCLDKEILSGQRSQLLDCAALAFLRQLPVEPREELFSSLAMSRGDLKDVSQVVS